MITNVSPIPVSAEQLERAALRLEFAASNLQLCDPRDDDAMCEALDEKERARTSYRALFELYTGLPAGKTMERLSL